MPTLLGSATIQVDIKQVHGHGLLGISRRSCPFAPGNPGLDPLSQGRMMPAPGEKSEAAKLMEMVQKVTQKT